MRVRSCSCLENGDCSETDTGPTQNVIWFWGLSDRSFKTPVVRGGSKRSWVKKPKRFSAMAEKWAEDAEHREASVTNVTCIEYFIPHMMLCWACGSSWWTKQMYGPEEENTDWEKLGFGHFGRDSRLKTQLWVLWGREKRGRRGYICVLFEEILRKSRETIECDLEGSGRPGETSAEAPSQCCRKRRQRSPQETGLRETAQG